MILTLVVLALAGCGGSSPGTPSGGADSGFRPGANGFPFQNYGNVLSGGGTPTNLTAHDVQMMFGDGVCADAQLRRCDLIPEAQAWLDSTNQAMAGGHCYGFSVLAELLWQHKLNVATLGAAATTDLAIHNNQALQRQHRLLLGAADRRLGAVQADHRHSQPDLGHAGQGAQAQPVGDLHGGLLEAGRHRRPCGHPLRRARTGAGGSSTC